MDRPVSVTALRCRTSDRTPGASQGAEALARALDPDARVIGDAGAPDRELGRRSAGLARRLHRARRRRSWTRRSSAGRFPVLTASDCSICLSTFSAVVKHGPDVRVVWFDAHGDSNTPETTPSGFLGGMCLGASVGLWDSGFAPALEPERVYGVGIRDLDPASGRRSRSATIAPAPFYVHLDLDVLDPSIMPAQFAVPGGLGLDGAARRVLASLENVVGVEVTAFEEAAASTDMASLRAGAAP